MEFPLEKKWDGIPPVEPPKDEEEISALPQVEYSVTLMMMSNGKPHVEITGTCTYPELLRLMMEAEENMRAELLADRIVRKLGVTNIKRL